MAGSTKIIIIGGTSGIGRAMAELYASKNFSVGITGRRTELLKELQTLYPDQIKTANFDVTGSENILHLQSLIQQLNGLDILIYNSGFGDTSAHLNPEIENTTTRTNVNGFVEITAYAFNYFAEQGYGQIALISSVAALRGNSWAPAYSASKAFMSTYAEGLQIKAQKLKNPIVITDIKPGFIDTKMAKGNARFWVAPPQKAARQIVTAIAKKKRVAYITKRWWLVAQILKLLPYSVYRRLA